MRLAHLDDSGRPQPLAVAGRLGCMVDMDLEVEEENSLDLVRMLANLYPDKDTLLPVQYILASRDLVGMVLLGSLDCVTTESNLVAAKSRCQGGGRGRLGIVENFHKL